MRRLALLVAVAGAFLAPATPAFAHGGDTPAAGGYRNAGHLPQPETRRTRHRRPDRAAAGLAHRWPGLVRPLALIAGCAPIAYAVSRTADGGSVPLVLFRVGLSALAAAWRHPPFFLALTGLAVLIFGGALPPAVRVPVLLAAGLGLALLITGALRLRPSAGPDQGQPAAGLSSSA